MRSEPPCVGNSSTSKSVSPWRAKTRLDGQKREVREVLVIDRVELVLARSAASGAGTPSSSPLRLEQELHPADEVVQIGNVGEHVVPDHEIRRLPSAPTTAPSRVQRTRRASGCPRSSAAFGHVGRRLDAQAQERRVLGSTAAGSRRCWRARPQGSDGRRRSDRPSAHVAPACSSQLVEYEEKYA